MARMAREEAIDEWRTYVLPTVKEEYEKDGRRDIPARSESWSNWIDGIIEDGLVPRSADSWAHPRECG